jgi:hypothetical protein
MAVRAHNSGLPRMVTSCGGVSANSPNRSRIFSSASASLEADVRSPASRWACRRAFGERRLSVTPRTNGGGAACAWLTASPDKSLARGHSFYALAGANKEASYSPRRRQPACAFIRGF